MLKSAAGVTSPSGGVSIRAGRVRAPRARFSWDELARATNRADRSRDDFGEPPIPRALLVRYDFLALLPLRPQAPISLDLATKMRVDFGFGINKMYKKEGCPRAK